MLLYAISSYIFSMFHSSIIQPVSDAHVAHSLDLVPHLVLSVCPIPISFLALSIPTFMAFCILSLKKTSPDSAALMNFRTLESQLETAPMSEALLEPQVEIS